MKSPISGLSLFVHLFIILVAVALSAILGEKRWLEVRGRLSGQSHSTSETFALRTISVLIILILASFMTLFMGIAIKTGIREGARESHIQFVQTEWNRAHDLITLLQNGNSYQNVTTLIQYIPVKTITYVRPQ